MIHVLVNKIDQSVILVICTVSFILPPFLYTWRIRVFAKTNDAQLDRILDESTLPAQYFLGRLNAIVAEPSPACMQILTRSFFLAACRPSPRAVPFKYSAQILRAQLHANTPRHTNTPRPAPCKYSAPSSAPCKYSALNGMKI